MNTSNIIDTIIKWLACTGLIAMLIFLCFGWLRGIERELRAKRRH